MKVGRWGFWWKRRCEEEDKERFRTNNVCKGDNKSSAKLDGCKGTDEYDGCQDQAGEYKGVN